MSGVGFLVSTAGQRAHRHFLHYARPAVPSVIPNPCPRPQPARAYVPSRLLASKLKGSTPTSPPVSSSIAAGAASASSSASIRKGFIDWYLGMIETRPLLTKALSAGAIFAAADVSSQMITFSSADSLDFLRTLRMGSYGLLISGPFYHCWYNIVFRILPKRDVLTTFKKILLGQAVYALMTAVFFSYNAGLRGEKSSEILARLERDLIPSFKRMVVYFPICDFITYKFIPVRLQPLGNNSFAFLWTIYITFMASLEKVSLED